MSDNFIPGLTFSLASGVIQINWDGTGAPNDFRAVFDVGSSLGGAVPEPGTWSLLILGFGVIGAGLRAGQRRRIGVSFA